MRGAPTAERCVLPLRLEQFFFYGRGLGVGQGACAAGVGPYGVLPLHDRAVVADVFAVLNARGPLGTMVAGQREPAEILARGPLAYFAPVYDVRMPA